MESILLRCESYVYRKLYNPYFVVSDEGTLMSVGEYEECKKYFETSVERYIKFGLTDMAHSLYFLPLPKNQVEVDKIFNISGYAKRYVPEKTSLLN